MKSNITVQTFDGTIANKRDCRFIKGDFYIKNKQCFLINDTWYRINSGFIIFDHETKNWVISKDNQGLLKGMVGYDKEKGEAIIGHFSKNAFKNVQVVFKNGGSMTCMDYKILPSNLFRENVKLMAFEHIDYKGTTSSTDNSFRASLSRRPRLIETKYPDVDFNNHGYPFQLQYGVKHYEKSFIDELRSSLKSNSLFQSNIGKYYNQLGNLSFGIEFETSVGKIPNYHILESGLVPLRDGSITGIEFATIPLSGKSGMLALENICSLLTKYTAISTNESLHLHIGNTFTSKKFVGYLYTLCCSLEKEIYSLFPQYYSQTSKFKPKGKDYNMPLRKEFVSDNLEETFSNLAFYLSDGKKYQGFGSNHPSDPDGSHKWQINSRYHWCNFIPLMFGSNNTIEFRVHVPTRDKIKVLSWLYICSAIVKYAENMHMKSNCMENVKSVTLKSILNSVYPSDLANYLNDYISFRKSERKINDAASDYIGTTEVRNEMDEKVYFNDISY